MYMWLYMYIIILQWGAWLYCKKKLLKDLLVLEIINKIWNEHKIKYYQIWYCRVVATNTKNNDSHFSQCLSYKTLTTTHNPVRDSSLSYWGHGEHTLFVFSDGRFLGSLLLFVKCETFPDSERLVCSCRYYSLTVRGHRHV